MAYHATECAFDKDKDKRQLPDQRDTRFFGGVAAERISCSGATC